MTLQQTLEELKPLLAKYKPFEIFAQDSHMIMLRWVSRDNPFPRVFIEADGITFRWTGQCEHCGYECADFQAHESLPCSEVPSKWDEWMKDHDYLLEKER